MTGIYEVHQTFGTTAGKKFKKVWQIQADSPSQATVLATAEVTRVHKIAYINSTTHIVERTDDPIIIHEGQLIEVLNETKGQT